MDPVLYRYRKKDICNFVGSVCLNDKPANDFRLVLFSKFMKALSVTSADHERLAVKLEDYLNCTIEFAGKVSLCNLENVMGSFYTKEDMLQYCYSIYSLWGNPNGKRKKLQKGAIMRFRIFVNASRRPDSWPRMPIPGTSENVTLPRYNPPTTPAIQMAVHSPYFLPSPYLEGAAYQGGKAYELRLNMEETHLLPAPYQTNCTDYMLVWKQRGGIAPMDQMGIIQECRVNSSYEHLACIPVTIDYPHSYDICKTTMEEQNNNSDDGCTLLADAYNQPCDSISYSTMKEDRMVTIVKEIASTFGNLKEAGRQRILAHDCSGLKVWNKECSTIEIDVLFDRFQITNLTYNAKFESLELFSVIGGYMGMWLGISLVAVYDFIGIVVTHLMAYRRKRKKRNIRNLKKKDNYTNSNLREQFSKNNYRTVWRI